MSSDFGKLLSHSNTVLAIWGPDQRFYMAILQELALESQLPSDPGAPGTLVWYHISSQCSMERQHLASKALKNLTFILPVHLPFTFLLTPPHWMTFVASHWMTFVASSNSMPLSCFLLIMEWNELCPYWFLLESSSSFKSYLATIIFVELFLTFFYWPQS